MNKILQLFDEAYVIELFEKELLPLYPDFSGINRVKITPYKKMIWSTTYHVVISFQVYFAKAGGGEERVPVVCSAHSTEERDKVYLALKYLWEAGLPSENIDIPEPLFYSEYFRGTFYRGLEGESLLRYIKDKEVVTIEEIIVSAAKLFARLHGLPAEERANFNIVNSRIATVVPGAEVVFQEVAARFSDKYDSDLRLIYSHLISREEDYFQKGGSLYIIHGDAHPENIIRTSPRRIGLIDFTDICLGDFARDLGSFIQQLEYKIVRKAGDAISAATLKELFLNTYLEAAGRKMTDDLAARIDLYYNWTAIRTATYWFLKYGHDEEAAVSLVDQVKKNLDL